jgi:hypothetical protein
MAGCSGPVLLSFQFTAWTGSKAGLPTLVGVFDKTRDIFQRWHQLNDRTGRLFNRNDLSQRMYMTKKYRRN